MVLRVWAADFATIISAMAPHPTVYLDAVRSGGAIPINLVLGCRGYNFTGVGILSVRLFCCTMQRGHIDQ